MYQMYEPVLYEREPAVSPRCAIQDRIMADVLGNHVSGQC